MSAFQQAVLSVAPERLEQFSLEMKKNIHEKPSKRNRKGESSADKNSSGHSKSKKHKRSSHETDSKKPRTSAVSDVAKMKSMGRKKKNEKVKKTSSRSRSEERKHRRKSSSGDKRIDQDKLKKAKDDSDFDPEDLELSTPLIPLSDLVKDRDALLETVFSIIKGPKLTSMLPDILKLKSLEEIKQLCKEQLNVMSSKRVLHALAGTEMESSSGTESSDDDQLRTRVTGTLSRKQKKEVMVAQDHSLQANFVDSTTSDHPAPSMLFPSAISAARAAVESADNIPTRKIANVNNEEDNVSTSTEPNFIYTEYAQDDNEELESFSSSDTEEGEVQSSDKESSSEDVQEEVPVPLVPKETEMKNALHGTEEVLVEVEEIEEDQEEDKSSIGGRSREDITPQRPTLKQKRRVAIKKTCSKEETEIAPNTVDAPAMTQENPNTVNKVDTNKSAGNSSDVYAGKSQLEILELELRARAIKSLMKAVHAGKLKSANSQ